MGGCDLREVAESGVLFLLELMSVDEEQGRSDGSDRKVEISC